MRDANLRRSVIKWRNLGQLCDNSINDGLENQIDAPRRVLSEWKILHKAPKPTEAKSEFFMQMSSTRSTTTTTTQSSRYSQGDGDGVLREIKFGRLIMAGKENFTSPR